MRHRQCESRRQQLPPIRLPLPRQSPTLPFSATDPYLLNYIDDAAYRRRILTQINRGEGRHRVIRAICYGRRGEIRKPYRQGQEDQLGALGLLTNAVVLWNTIYMEAALNHLRAQGVKIQPADLARLSPLRHKHIYVLGRYAFTLPEPIANGALRPLNQDELDDP